MRLNKREVISFQDKSYIIAETLIHENNEFFYLLQVDDNDETKIIGNPIIVYMFEDNLYTNINMDVFNILSNKFQILLNIQYSKTV